MPAPALPNLAGPNNASIDKAGLQTYASQVEAWFNGQPMDPSVAGKAKASMAKFRKVVGELLALPDSKAGGGGGAKPAAGAAKAPA